MFGAGRTVALPSAAALPLALRSARFAETRPPRSPSLEADVIPILSLLLFATLAPTPGAVVPSATIAQASPAHAPSRAGDAQADSAAVAAAVNRFHAALAAGDSAASLALLAPDAEVLESGERETRAEYRAHHLAADIEFARAVRSERGPVRVRVHGDVAWATTMSTTRGTFRGRAIDSTGAELMVLVRTDGGWRIAAIHWSSHRRS